MMKLKFRYFVLWAVILGIIFLLFYKYEATDKELLSDQLVSIKLPPKKSVRHIELEKIQEMRGLIDKEMEEFLHLNKERENAWKEQPSMRDVLQDLPKEKRRNELILILREKGLTKNEIQRYMEIVDKRGGGFIGFK